MCRLIIVNLLFSFAARQRMRIFIYTYLLRPLLEVKELKSRVFVIYKVTLKVPLHDCRKRKAENEQLITEHVRRKKSKDLL